MWLCFEKPSGFALFCFAYFRHLYLCMSFKEICGGDSDYESSARLLGRVNYIVRA